MAEPARPGAVVRVTVCETPHGRGAAERAWMQLRAHCHDAGSQVLVLPEFAFLPPVWQRERYDPACWRELEHDAALWLARLPELPCACVIGSMPATVAGARLNQGFLWTPEHGVLPLHGKHSLPNEPGGWEARWFDRGSGDFPVYDAGPLRFGLNICTELWALDTLGAYARGGAHAVVTPRATAAATTDRWLALARTVAVRTGAFSLSSNRRHADGSCGGAGWIIDPEGVELARTSAQHPAVTMELALADSEAARSRYPRYVFADPMPPAAPSLARAAAMEDLTTHRLS